MRNTHSGKTRKLNVLYLRDLQINKEGLRKEKDMPV